jgi:hypothetical protein
VAKTPEQAKAEAEAKFEDAQKRAANMPTEAGYKGALAAAGTADKGFQADTFIKALANNDKLVAPGAAASLHSRLLGQGLGGSAAINEALEKGLIRRLNTMRSSNSGLFGSDVAAHSYGPFKLTPTYGKTGATGWRLTGPGGIDSTYNFGAFGPDGLTDVTPLMLGSTKDQYSREANALANYLMNVRAGGQR